MCDSSHEIRSSLLKNLTLYSGKVINEIINDKGFMCKCRHSHIFKYSTLNDWCIKCAEPKFQQDLCYSINESLKELDSIFHLLRVNRYGIGEIICKDNHKQKVDIDEISNDCIKCGSDDCSIRQVSHDIHIWGDSVKKLNIKHTDIHESSIDYESEPEIIPIKEIETTKNNKEHRTNNMSTDYSQIQPKYCINKLEDLHIVNAIQLCRSFNLYKV